MKIRTQAFLPLFVGVLLHGWIFVGTASAVDAAKAQAAEAAKAKAAELVASQKGAVTAKATGLLGGFMSKVSGAAPATGAATAPNTSLSTAPAAQAKSLFGGLLGQAKAAVATVAAPATAAATDAAAAPASKPGGLLGMFKSAAGAAVGAGTASLAAQAQAGAPAGAPTGGGLLSGLTGKLTATIDQAKSAVNQVQGVAQGTLDQAKGALATATPGGPDAAPAGGGLMGALAGKMSTLQSTAVGALGSAAASLPAVEGTGAPGLPGGLTEKLAGLKDAGLAKVAGTLGSNPTSSAAAISDLDALQAKLRSVKKGSKVSAADQEANLALIKSLMAKQSSNELSSRDMLKLQGMLKQAQSAGVAPRLDLEVALRDTAKNVAASKTKSSDREARHDDRDSGASKGKKAQTPAKGKKAPTPAKDKGGTAHNDRQPARGGGDKKQEARTGGGGQRGRGRAKRGERRRQRRKGKAMRNGKSRANLMAAIKRIKEGRSGGRARGAVTAVKASHVVMAAQQKKIKDQLSVINQLKKLQAGGGKKPAAKPAAPAHVDTPSKGAEAIKDKAASSPDADRRKAAVGARSSGSSAKPTDADASRRADAVKKRGGADDGAASKPSVSEADRRKAAVGARAAATA